MRGRLCLMGVGAGARRGWGLWGRRADGDRRKRGWATKCLRRVGMVGMVMGKDRIGGCLEWVVQGWIVP